MTDPANEVRRAWRRRLRWLIATPLHPQWHVARLSKERIAWVAARAQGDVLDVGCADGAICRHLAAAKSYLGVDYPATASGLYGTRPHVYADGARLPFANGCFDTVMLLDVLEHMALPEAALRECARVLRPSGRLLIVVPLMYPLHDQPHDYQRFTAHGLRHRLASVGLQAINLEEAGSAIQAATLAMTISLAQGALDAFARGGLRLVAVPVALVVLPILNILGWMLAQVVPVHGLLPLGYYVEARRS